MTGILVVVGLLIGGAILARTLKAGADREKAKLGEQNAKTAERIADAHADAPANLSALRDGLRDGSRKL